MKSFKCGHPERSEGLGSSDRHVTLDRARSFVALKMTAMG
jgi:hypothetical protein